MSFQRLCVLHPKLLPLLLSAAACLPALAQRPYTETDTYRTRSSVEKILIPRKAKQVTKGVLGVVLNPVIQGKIFITDAQGRTETKEADASGKAVFELRRGLNYQVKASFPGFLDTEKQILISKPSDSLQLNLTPQFAQIELPGLPKDAAVSVDGQPVTTADASGLVRLSAVKPGDRTFLIQHAEYNDYSFKLSDLKAGKTLIFAPLNSVLTKVARLGINTSPHATVLIDGAVQGRVNADGQVNLDYELPQAGEHVVSVELIGHQTWTQKIVLKPGPLTINATLTPIVTSVGESDQFDSLNLSRWTAPDSWKLVKEGTNGRLQIGGERLGVLKEKLYRNFEVHFTVWLADGKGATWAVRADREGKRYYLFHLAGTNPAEGLTSRRFYTYLMQDGVLTEVNSPVAVLTKLNNKDSYTIHLTVKEFVITHDMTSNVDGEPNDLGVYTDTTTTKERSLYGTFGFRSFKGEVFQVDDFTLAPLP